MSCFVVDIDGALFGPFWDVEDAQTWKGDRQGAVRSVNNTGPVGVKLPPEVAELIEWNRRREP